MNARVDQLLPEALRLPADERSALVMALLESIESSADASISEASQADVRQRRQALAAGAVKAVPWVEARARLGAS